MKMPEMDMKDVNFGNAFQQLLAILKLDKAMIKKVADNKSGGATAAIFLLIGTATLPVLQMIFGMRILNQTFRPDITATLLGIVGALVSTLLSYVVVTLVATKLFKGKGSFAQYFRVGGLVAGIGVVSGLIVFVPALGAIISLVVALWGLVVGYVVLKEVFHLDDKNAILTIIVAVIAIVIIQTIFNSLGLSGAASQAGFDLSSVSY